MTLAHQITHMVTDIKRMQEQFPKRVAEGKMSKHSADSQIDMHQEVINTLLSNLLAQKIAANTNHFAPVRGQRVDVRHEVAA